MAELKRFGFGLQALIVLATRSGQYSSNEIASYIHCEPTALRKILSRLTDGGFIEVRQGRGGGYTLAKRPGEITLAEVYRRCMTKGRSGMECWIPQAIIYLARRCVNPSPRL